MSKRPDIEYLCNELHWNVPRTLEERVARCGSVRCEGIAMFRSNFFLYAVPEISTLVAGGSLLEEATRGLKVNSALFITIYKCEKEGHCLTFRKWPPAIFVFSCRFCEREEKVQLNEKLEEQDLY